MQKLTLQVWNLPLALFLPPEMPSPRPKGNGDRIMNVLYYCNVKSGLLFCGIFFVSLLYGQEDKGTYSAFAINNKEVIWVQVFHASQSIDSLQQHVFDFLKRKAWIKELHFDGPEIVADIRNFRVDYKRFGGKYMNTSNLIRTGRWLGNQDMPRKSPSLKNPALPHFGYFTPSN
jgi:hypothetical protein